MRYNGGVVRLACGHHNSLPCVAKADTHSAAQATQRAPLSVLACSLCRQHLHSRAQVGKHRHAERRALKRTRTALMNRTTVYTTHTIQRGNRTIHHLTLTISNSVGLSSAVLFVFPIFIAFVSWYSL